MKTTLKLRQPPKGTQAQNEDDQRIKDNLNNKDNIKNKDNLKNRDDLKI